MKKSTSNTPTFTQLSLKLLPVVICTIANMGDFRAEAQELSPDATNKFRSRLNSTAGTLDALHEIEMLDGTASQLAPEISRLVRADDDRIMRAAVRCVSKLGERGVDVAPDVISNLDHHDYLVRAELYRALVSIGPAVIPQLKDELNSASPRVRCCALSALNKLTILDSEILSKLGKDSDARIRIGVAEGWKKHGSAGIKQIVRLLRDSKPAAAAGIAKALRFHFVDTELTVPALADCLERKDVGATAAVTLQSYRVDAKAAIPMLVKSYPLGFVESNSLSYGDAAEVAIEHIGLARPSDLNLLHKLLSSPHSGVRALAARTIGQMGPAAKQSLETLKLLLERAMKKMPKIIEDSEALSEFEREQFLPVKLDEPIAAMLAIWQIERNTPQLVEHLQSLVSQVNDSVYFENESFFENLTAKDLPPLVQLLASPDANITGTAVSLFYNLPPDIINFETLAQIRQLDNEDATYVFQHIVQGTTFKDSKKIEAWLLEDFRAETLDLQEFCDAAATQKFNTPATIKILNDGILSKDQYTPDQCLEARAAIAGDADEAAKLLISAAEANPRLRRTALESLWPSVGPIELVVPFALKCLDDSDGWTKRRAVSELARIGPPAHASLARINELLTTKSKVKLFDRDMGTIAQAAIAIATISGDSTEMRKLFEASLIDSSRPGEMLRHEIADGLEQLGPHANPYFDMLAALAKFEDANRVTSNRSFLENRLKQLAAVGSPQAISLLEKYSTDRDHKIRILVERLLQSAQVSSVN